MFINDEIILILLTANIVSIEKAAQNTTPLLDPLKRLS